MKVLWVGDAACDSGFAKGTHYILDRVRIKHKVGVLGINFWGDDHDWPYPIYPAWKFPKGDILGVRRIQEMLRRSDPDVIIYQNDTWNIPAYVEEVAEHVANGGRKPIQVGALAVDGKNVQGRFIEGLDFGIFWTQFALDEARKGGFTKPATVIGLGVDTKFYNRNLDRAKAQAVLGIPEEMRDGFWFLNVNRNQPRKRLDITMEAFAEFYHNKPHRGDVYLYLHVCPTGDLGWDLKQLAGYFNLHGRVMLATPGNMARGTDERYVLATYRAANVQISTTQGEGWGLTTLEGMACGVPQVVPDWSALGEWARPAAMLVPPHHTTFTPNTKNMLGAVPHPKDVAEAMWKLYSNPRIHELYSQRSFELAQREEFNWENIGDQYSEVIDLLCQESSSTPTP